MCFTLQEKQPRVVVLQLKVTCTCLGENGPFFRAFCMLCFCWLTVLQDLGLETEKEEVLAAGKSCDPHLKQLLEE